jgi:hypothetical protein
MMTTNLVVPIPTLLLEPFFVNGLGRLGLWDCPHLQVDIDCHYQGTNFLTREQLEFRTGSFGKLKACNELAGTVEHVLVQEGWLSSPVSRVSTVIHEHLHRVRRPLDCLLWEINGLYLERRARTIYSRLACRDWIFVSYSTRVID